MACDHNRRAVDQGTVAKPIVSEDKASKAAIGHYSNSFLFSSQSCISPIRGSNPSFPSVAPRPFL